MPIEKAAPILLLLMISLLSAGGCASAEIDKARSSPPNLDILTDSSMLDIQIEADGLYTIELELIGSSGSEIVGNSRPDYLLSEGGKVVPIHLTDSALLFYGQAPDSRYSTHRTYRLQVGKSGVLMAHSAVSSGDLPLTPTISKTIHFEENHLYDGSASGALKLSGQEFEPWFWQTIQVGSVGEIEVELPDEPVGYADLSLGLWGITENNLVDADHDLDVIVNGKFVSKMIWDGQTYYSNTLSLPATDLEKGSNIILLDNQDDGAAAIDISRLDWVEVSYQAAPTVFKDQLQISDTQGIVKASGFTGRPIALDISNQDEPIILTGWEYVAGLATLPVSKERDLLLVGPAGFLQPASLDKVAEGDLRSNTDQADMIIVTTEELAPPLQPLIAAREAQSLTVRLVTLNEIYKNFSRGQDGPDAISEFIRFAFHNWDEPSPRYLFLVGEGSYDYRAYLQEGPTNIVPSPMVAVRFSGETVSDGLFGDLDGDHKPDLAVGRWPVDDPEAVESLVARTLAYEKGVVADSAIFVADGSNDGFTKFNSTIVEKSDFQTGSVNQIAGASDEDLLQTWNDGAWLVTYAGHGSLDRWGKESVLTNEAVGSLKSSSAPPIVLQLTCLTGYFAHPLVQSLSETLLLNDSGPVLIIAATSLTLSQNQQPFAINMLRQLMDPGVIRIGDAFVQAKADLDVSDPGIREISDTFGLLGDPATLIARPD